MKTKDNSYRMNQDYVELTIPSSDLADLAELDDLSDGLLALGWKETSASRLKRSKFNSKSFIVLEFRRDLEETCFDNIPDFYNIESVNITLVEFNGNPMERP